EVAVVCRVTTRLGEGPGAGDGAGEALARRDAEVVVAERGAELAVGTDLDRVRGIDAHQRAAGVPLAGDGDAATRRGGDDAGGDDLVAFADLVAGGDGVRDRVRIG